MIIIMGFILIFQIKTARSSKINPIFHESFNSYNSIQANGGKYKDISLVQGKIGKGVLIQDRGNLVFPVQNHFNFQKGTIEFWIKPQWDGRYDLKGKAKYLLEIVWGNTQSLLFANTPLFSPQ